MIHEVKIPTGCKASVSVDNEKIVVLIDPVEDFVTIDEEALKKRWLDEIEAKAWDEHNRKVVDGALSGSPKINPLDSISVRGKILIPEIQVDKIEYNPDTDNQGTIMPGVSLTGYEVNKSSGALCDEENRILTKVHPGMVVKSETGHIALVGSSDYTVVLTPNKEIQLNQTCNFPFEYHATKEESEELFEQLKMQKALEVSDYGTIVNWWPNENDSYDAINSSWGITTLVNKGSALETLLFEAANVFPVGFITEERQQQLKETLKNLFDSWRK